MASTTCTTDYVRAVLTGAVERLWALADQADTSHTPGGMSMSRIGACARQSAYRMAGRPFDEGLTDTTGRAAQLGTWLHVPVLRWLARALPGKTWREHPVTLNVAGITIAGRLDLAWRTVVIDAKTTREYYLSYLRRGDDLRPAVRAQVASYALAREQAGHPVSHIAYVYVDRSDGGTQTIVEEFTDDLRTLVVDRVTALAGWAMDPDTAPREERGPGLSVVCDGCPFLNSCFGADAVPGQTGPQTQLLGAEAGSVEDVLALYSNSSGTAKRADDDKRFARAILNDTAPGVYGPYKLGWGRGRPPKPVPDADAMERRLLELGEVVPTKMGGGASGAISVTLVKAVAPKPDGAAACG